MSSPVFQRLAGRALASDGQPRVARIALVLATALVAVAVAPAGAYAGTAGQPAPAQGPGWTLSTDSSKGDYNPPFIGNGYLGERIPADGAGYAARPVETQSQVAGFYAKASEAYPREERASVPTWSTLNVSDGSGTYGHVPQSTGCAYDGVCEAENAALSGGTSVATNHGGFSGSGFVQGYGGTGASTAFTVGGVPSDGTYTVAFRYANFPAGSGNPGSCLPRTLSIHVNGRDAVQATLEDTHSWDAWATYSADLPLTAGSDTIAVVQDADDCGSVNVDYLTVSAPGQPLPVPQSSDSGTVSDFHQQLDMHDGAVTTAATWTSPAGNVTRLTYRVFADRADEHVAVVRMTMTPQWSGQATVLAAMDGADAARLTRPATKAADPRRHEISESVKAIGTGITAALASRLDLSGIDVQQAKLALSDVPESIGEEVSFPVQAGRAYTITKYVGLTTSQEDDDPVAAALAAARRAEGAGFEALARENSTAWDRIWRSRIDVAGDDQLQSEVRAAAYSLLASTRAGVDWSVSPAGLSSNGYAGHIFWDAETWMYPSLLLTQPDIAKGMDTYRQQRLAAAEQHAQDTGNQGAQFPWESALTGEENIGMSELHVTADVALAQWQYYLATGDRGWLAEKAWPVLAGTADFFAHLASPDGQGGYDIRGVIPPDEYHTNVTNSAYTNVAAITTLRMATQAARLVGRTPDPLWTTVADGLKVPFDASLGVHPEYDGYAGDVIKQADVVMLQYPWSWPMPDAVAQADLDYYAPRTDTGGPSMTDAIHMIDTAALGTAGCASYTYMKRSVEPFMRPPFDQFSEYRGGGAFTFTTGAGGFLQEFLYGLTGFRWDADAVRLDPMLPPQLPGVTLRRLAWHGRSFTVHIGPRRTEVRLEDGAPLPVRIAGGGVHTLHEDAALVVPTRRPDLEPTRDLARCRTVTATASDPSFPAIAAVDGSPATEWRPNAGGASLTVDLGTVRKLSDVTVRSATGATTGYAIDVSDDGRTWRTLGNAEPASDPTSSVTADGASARFVRYTADAGVSPRVSALEVN